MKTVNLIREEFTSKATFGKWFLEKEWFCSTLEEPWKQNKSFVSCIPDGKYKVELGYSPKFKRNVYHVLGVPDRTYIEVHPGNTVKDTLGCILLGKRKGRQPYLTESFKTTQDFMNIMNGKPFWLIIESCQK